MLSVSLWYTDIGMLSHSLTSEARERGLSGLDLKFESHGQVDCIRSAGNGWDLLREKSRDGKRTPDWLLLGRLPSSLRCKIFFHKPHQEKRKPWGAKGRILESQTSSKGEECWERGRLKILGKRRLLMESRGRWEGIGGSGLKSWDQGEGDKDRSLATFEGLKVTRRWESSPPETSKHTYQLYVHKCMHIHSHTPVGSWMSSRGNVCFL